MLSILAGVMISIGGAAYLQHNNIIGAILFSIGLITIVLFKFELFTGKAGLYAANKITKSKLIEIWFGNFLGTFITSFGIIMTPKGLEIAEAAQEILQTRISNGFLANLVLGIFCGLLMYIAVTGFAKTNNYLFLILPVVTFIMSGYNHCIADMFYVNLGSTGLKDYLVLIPTTIGNFIGTNIISWCLKYSQNNQD